MKKFLSVLILLSLLLCLCACGEGTPPESPPAEAVRHSVMKSSFPMGMDGQLLGVCAVDGGVFVGGMQDGAARLLRLDYALDDGGVNLGNAKALELPEHEGAREFIALSRGGDKVYALFAFQVEDNKDKTYIVSVYASNGAPESSHTLPVRENADIKSFLAAEDGTLCLRELHHLSLFSPAGESLCLISDLDNDFAPPLLIDGEFVAQVRNGMSIESTLCRVDAENAALIPIKSEDMILLSCSRCQSVDDTALINDGSELYSVDKSAHLTELLNWYELSLDYGSDYRFICCLGENDLLLIPKDSYELIAMHITSTVPTRTVRVAFCGDDKSKINVLENMFRHYTTDYKVESQYYSNEAADVTRLQMELGSKNGIDLLICDSYLIDPSTGFVDLYPLLDADDELSRDDFPRWMLEGIAQHGRLNQIWGSFGIYTYRASGPLVKEPEPLKLKDCQAVLDENGVLSPLLDSYYTKDSVLSMFADSIFAATYDEASGSYKLDTPYVRELLEFCDSRPLEDPYNIQDGNLDNIDSSLWYSEYVRCWPLGVYGSIADKDSPYSLEPCRYFDGRNGGDNFSSLTCAPIGCYLIPKTCQDVENAWGFLRSLLTTEFQTAFYKARGTGLPSNSQAYEQIASSVCTPEMQEQLNYMISHSPVRTYDSLQLNNILVSSIQPWFNGDATLENALSNAQGRVNIFTAERAD